MINTSVVIQSPDGSAQAGVGANGRLSTDTVVTNSSQNYLALNQLFSLGLDLSLATAGVDNPTILIKNPIGSGKNLFLYRITVGITVTNVSAEFKAYATPVVTANGTILTPISRFIGAASVSSVMQAYSLPTVTSDGLQLSCISIGTNCNSGQLVDEFSVAIAPGGALLITGNPNSNNRNAAISVAWAEVPI